jgi:hypothetical protein
MCRAAEWVRIAVAISQAQRSSVTAGERAVTVVSEDMPIATLVHLWRGGMKAV